MYETFFGLRERPFDLTPNPRYLVLTDSHQEALSNLEYAIASRKGITLLVGEAGSGKTTVIRAAIERQPARVHSVHLHNPTMTRAEFNELLAMRMGLSERAGRSKAVFLVEIENLLRHRHARGEATLVVIDEAQSLPLELLEEIRLLVNIESDDHKLLSVIIAGQPELASRLNDVSLRQLKQRVALRCHLRCLTESETLGLHRRARPRRRGVGQGHLHARGDCTDSREIPWHPSHRQRHCGQCLARWFRERRAAGRQLDREGSVRGLRLGCAGNPSPQGRDAGCSQHAVLVALSDPASRAKAARRGGDQGRGARAHARARDVWRLYAET